MLALCCRDAENVPNPAPTHAASTDEHILAFRGTTVTPHPPTPPHPSFTHTHTHTFNTEVPLQTTSRRSKKKIVGPLNTDRYRCGLVLTWMSSTHPCPYFRTCTYHRTPHLPNSNITDKEKDNIPVCIRVCMHGRTQHAVRSPIPVPAHICQLALRIIFVRFLEGSIKHVRTRERNVPAASSHYFFLLYAYTYACTHVPDNLSVQPYLYMHTHVSQEA